MTGFQVVTQYGRVDPLFHLVGQLGAHARFQLDEILRTVGSDCQRLRLDLSRVDEVDVSGLSWLLMADNRLKLDIVAASPAARRALSLLRPASKVMHMGSRRNFSLKGLRHTSRTLHKAGC